MNEGAVSLSTTCCGNVRNDGDRGGGRGDGQTGSSRPPADIPRTVHFLPMKPLKPTVAELRERYLLLRTWAALTAVGLVVTLVRDVLFDIPHFPIRTGATPFLTLTSVGALYAGSVLTWLALRKRTAANHHISTTSAFPDMTPLRTLRLLFIVCSVALWEVRNK